MSPSSDNKKGLSYQLKIFLAGGIAGCVAKTSVAPLERIKILFQISSPHYPYIGVFSTMKSIIHKEGILGLWKGNNSSVIRVFPYAAIQFVAFENYRKVLTHFGRHVHIILVSQNFLSGALAGGTAVLFTYPLDLIRARLASQVVHQHYKGVRHSFQMIYQHEGFWSLYKGMSPTMMGIFPYAGFNFFFFEKMKSLYVEHSHKIHSLSSSNRNNYNNDNHQSKKKNDDEEEERIEETRLETKEIPPLIRLVIGAISGLLGQTATYPLDVVRRQMQLEGFATSQVKYKSTFHALQTIFKNQGFTTGLFRGVSINWMKAAPTVGISFTTYDTIKKLLDVY